MHGFALFVGSGGRDPQSTVANHSKIKYRLNQIYNENHCQKDRALQKHIPSDPFLLYAVCMNYNPENPVHGSIELKPNHRDACTDRAWVWGSQFGEVGDVRRCEHGKLQVIMTARHGGLFWYTLSRFYDPILYSRANKAWLRAQSELCASHKKPS